MILDTAITAQPTPDARQDDTLELLLQDREWVAAKFAAIMTASGFGDRVIVGPLPRPPQNLAQRWDGEALRWRSSARLPIRGAAARVRSPPGRS